MSFQYICVPYNRRQTDCVSYNRRQTDSVPYNRRKSELLVVIISFQYICVPYNRRQTELILEFDLNLELSHPELQQPLVFITSFPPALSTVLIIVFAANITSLEFTNMIASAISIAIDAWKNKGFLVIFPIIKCI